MHQNQKPNQKKRLKNRASNWQTKKPKQKPTVKLCELKHALKRHNSSKEKATIKLHLISIGKNLPAWVNSGYTEYTKRLPKNFALELIEIPLSKRSKNNDIAHLKQEEGQKLLRATPKNSLIITLDEHGKIWSTQELAYNLQKWQNDWQHVSFLIGGPDGLSDECLKKAHHSWSLSQLTFPHFLVRVIIAEQIYRAWSLLQHHPYHRI